jgi:hypothetical protein
VFDLGGAQDFVEEQVVNVQQRIAGDEGRLVVVAGLLVDREELLFGAGCDDEAVLGQLRPQAGGEQEWDAHVAEIGGDRLVGRGRDYVDDGFIVHGEDRQGGRRGRRPLGRSGKGWRGRRGSLEGGCRGCLAASAGDQRQKDQGRDDRFLPHGCSSIVQAACSRCVRRHAARPFSRRSPYGGPGRFPWRHVQSVPRLELRSVLPEG